MSFNRHRWATTAFGKAEVVIVDEGTPASKATCLICKAVFLGEDSLSGAMACVRAHHAALPERAGPPTPRHHCDRDCT